jgi:hypothetical protein
VSWTNTSTTAEEKKDRETSKEEKALLYSDECISELEVVKAEKQWGDGIVRIGNVYTEGGDCSNKAAFY